MCKTVKLYFLGILRYNESQQKGDERYAGIKNFMAG